MRRTSFGVVTVLGLLCVLYGMPVPAQAQLLNGTVWSALCHANLASVVQDQCTLPAIPQGNLLVIENTSVRCAVEGTFILPDMSEARLELRIQGAMRIFDIPLTRTGAGTRSGHLAHQYAGVVAGPLYSDSSQPLAFTAVRFSGNVLGSSCTVTVLGRLVAIPQ